MTEKHRFETCYLCTGKRFFDLGNGRHYPCPLCGMDGSILVKDGEVPPVPEGLVRRIINDLEQKTPPAEKPAGLL